METLPYRIELPKIQPVYFHLIGDVHRASRGCDAKKFRSDINRIAKLAEQECHRVILLGDLCNSIGKGDPRVDFEAVSPEFHEHVGRDLLSAEARVVARELKPIAPICVGILMGNHEEKAARKLEYHPTEDIAERLDIPFLGYSAFIRVVMDFSQHTATLIIRAFHGRGAARSEGAKLNVMLSEMVAHDADVYVTGHTHLHIDVPKIQTTVNRRGKLRLIAREKHFANCGTYVKSYAVDRKPQVQGRYNESRKVSADYAERAGYSPTVIGHNGFVVYPRKSITVSGSNRQDWCLQIRPYDCRW